MLPEYHILHENKMKKEKNVAHMYVFSNNCEK